MEEPNYLSLLGSMAVNPPATEEAIERLSHAVDADPPTSYLDLLRATDGAEGWIGENYIRIFSTARIIEEPYPFKDSVPGLLLFGSDGAAGLFAFDVQGASDRVLVVHSDDLELSHVVELSASLGDFLKLLGQRFWSDVWAERYKGD